MSAGLLTVVTFIYLAVAVSLWIEGRGGMSLAFGGYALANVGFIYDLLTKGN